MTESIELTTVGEMLKEEFIDPLGLTQNALASAIFVPPNRIHQIIKGTRRITADTDLRLTKYFGMSQGFFLRYQEDYELRIARRKIKDELNNIISFKATSAKTKRIVRAGKNLSTDEKIKMESLLLKQM